jgi:hypothetical protein
MDEELEDYFMLSIRLWPASAVFTLATSRKIALDPHGHGAL